MTRLKLKYTAMIVENKPSYYIGTVTYVESDPLGLLTKDKLYHEAVVAVPGVFENVLAFPGRNQLDEPKVGDLVVVCSWDPVYNSYCTYEKLKENDFVGFRSSGKMVQINHDKIVVGVFDESQEYKDDDVPDVSPIAHLEMDKDGNIEVHAAKNITVNGDSDCTITIKGNTNLKVEGNSKIKVAGNMEAKVSGNGDINISGSTKLTSPNVTVTGGTMTVGGTCTVTGQGGFCGIPNCIFSGVPHQSHIISNT